MNTATSRPRRRLRRRATQATTDRRVSQRLAGRWGRLIVVLFLALAPMLVAAPATALPNPFGGGFDCKDVPTPELPASAFQTAFDSSSSDRQAPGENSTGYMSYGWAGLGWSTYDLGCGPDLTRAPRALADTAMGNTFLSIGKTFASAAFWLDDQTKTGVDAAEAGVTPALAEFDKIVVSISRGMFGVYSMWLGIALTIVSVIVLWHAFKADSASVTKTVMFAGAAMALGALMVGAPQKAIQVADDSLGSLITETQGSMFEVAFGDGQGGNSATLSSGPTDPRNVLLDKIFLPDWRAGWFGANYPPEVEALGPDLRDSLAFSYAEQQQIKNDPKSATDIVEAKAQKFEDVVSQLGDYGLSYEQFTGKKSGRTGTGVMAMIKLAMPSVLWIGASILKITALLAIRFAVLFAPIWVPLAIIHGGLMLRVCRILATAYMWGVAGAVIIALYLMALVQLYVTDNGNVDGAWRLWFMILLTAICWFIMRPFKRITQTLTQNHASLINRKARSGQKSLKHKAFDLASFAVGGPAQAISERVVGGMRKRGDIDDDGAITPERPEGRELNHRRQSDATHSRVEARQGMQRAAQNRADRLHRADDRDAERDARIAGIAATAANTKFGLSEDESQRAAEYGIAARDRGGLANDDDVSKDDSAAVTVGQRWNGGDSSAIAPMKVYTPPPRTVGGVTPMVVITAGHRPAAAKPPAVQRLWDPSLRPDDGRDL